MFQPLKVFLGLIETAIFQVTDAKVAAQAEAGIDVLARLVGRVQIFLDGGAQCLLALL